MLMSNRQYIFDHCQQFLNILNPWNYVDVEPINITLQKFKATNISVIFSYLFTFIRKFIIESYHYLLCTVNRSNDRKLARRKMLLRKCSMLFWRNNCNSVFSVFKVHYFWLNLFGYAPFTLVENDKKIEIKTHIEDILFWIFALTMNLLVMYGFYELEIWKKFDSFLLGFCILITTHTECSATFILLVMHFVKRKKIVDLIQSIQLFDDKVR
jgi:hypothetical protein